MCLEYGVNHINAAARYGEQAAHRSWMKLTGTGFPGDEDGKLGKAADRCARPGRLRQIIDLFQMHNLSAREEWEVAWADGALEFVEAREEGLVRFIGVTGHGTQIARLHINALGRFDFDSVLLPYSYTMMQNPRYAADFVELLGLCNERNVAVQTIKSITRAPWGEQPHTRSTWYQPLEAQGDIDLAVHWVLGNPAVFLNGVGDIHLLPRVLDGSEIDAPHRMR
jgi:predicted aldo/keto reductase-like oxidoreductase